MKKWIMLALVVSCATAEAKEFRITPARVGNIKIRRYDDAEFATSFNYLKVQAAYPYIGVDYLTSLPNQENLWRVCKKEVLNILKTPGAAKFPKVGKVLYSAPGGIYYISGSVDSQNSYGALLRGGFACSMVYTGDLKSGSVYTLVDFFENDHT